MKKNYIGCIAILFFCLSTARLSAQNVAINTSGNPAYVSAILDLSNNNTPGTLGFLPPYVTFNSALSNFQIAGTPAQSNGIIVYNTGGINPAGLYYWNNSIPSWVSLGGTTLIGAGTLNYLARWTPNGNTLGIGVTQDNGITAAMNTTATGPVPTQMLTVTGNGTAINAIVGTATFTGGTGVTGSLNNPSSSGGYGVQGLISCTNTGGGFQYALYGSSTVTLGNGIGVYGAATGVGSAINYGGYFTASGGSFNYGIIVPPAGGFVGFGTVNPARQLEIGGTANTIRIGGITTAGTFYSTTTPTTAASSVMFTNNTTGDVQALAPTATNGYVLTQTAAGPAWQSYTVLVGIKFVTASTGPVAFDAGTTSIVFELVGGGGGGGGINNSQYIGAAGGGAGAYCKGFVAGLTAASTYSVTIGAGGTAGTNGGSAGGAGGLTTFATQAPINNFTANGGSGGAGQTSEPSQCSVVSGGAGGAAGVTGSINFPGKHGDWGMSAPYNAAAEGGGGGNSVFGAAGVQVAAGINGATTAAGVAASPNTGSGGSGAATVTPSGQFGGAGGTGVVIIYEYK